MADDHPYLDLPIPKYAPIELRPTPGKGWGVFATRDIKRGSLIMKERAMFIIQKQSDNITEQDVYEAVQRLSDLQMHIIACLSGNRPRELSNVAWRIDLLEIILSRKDGVCFLAIHASIIPCQPNAGVPESPSESPSGSQVGKNSMSSYAERDIAAGEEITISYKNGFRSRTLDERHRLLEFECRCTVCDRASKDPTFRQVSDLRRRLIRGLIYLLDGIDENSKYDDDDSHSRPVICDPIMRKAADNCDFPLSARLIYDLLLVSLTDAEGLLDIETAANTWTHVWRRACSFGTEENGKIAKLAVQQKSWTERLGMAFQLDGRADAADYGHTLAYRQVKGIKV